jgi:hypothetical protein
MYVVLSERRPKLPHHRRKPADNIQLYLVHWPVAFQKGESYFPLVEGSTVEGGDVVIDDGVSIVDTWKGEWSRLWIWDRVCKTF